MKTTAAILAALSFSASASAFNPDVDKPKTSAQALAACNAYNKRLGNVEDCRKTNDTYKTLKGEEVARAAAKAKRALPGVTLGMRSEDVPTKTSWGKPERINRTTNAHGTSEQWVYPGYHSYLYFDNGVLTSIQN